MKELYTSPEVKLINFLSQENLANGNDPDMSSKVVDQILDEDISLDLSL